MMLPISLQGQMLASLYLKTFTVSATVDLTARQEGNTTVCQTFGLTTPLNINPRSKATKLLNTQQVLQKVDASLYPKRFKGRLPASQPKKQLFWGRSTQEP